MNNMEVISQKKEPSWILSEGRHSHAFWVRSVAVYLLFYRCSVWHTGHFCSSEMPGNSWANPAPLHWTHVWNSPCFPTKLQAGCSMHPTSRVTETSQPYGNQHAWKAACHSIRWFSPCAGYYPCRSMSSNPQAHLHLLYSDPSCSGFQSGCPCRLESSMAWLLGIYSFMTAHCPRCFLWKVTEARSPAWKAVMESTGHSVELRIRCSVSGTWSPVSRNTRCAIIRYYTGREVKQCQKSITALSYQGDPTDRIPSSQTGYPNPARSRSHRQAASYSQHLGLSI